MLVLLLVAGFLGAAAGEGAAECLCLAPDSPLLAATQNALPSQYPAGYGQGCKAHDGGLKIEGCLGGAGAVLPYYCSASWCYIDPEVCQENKAICEAAGSVLGSSASPFCRSRPMIQSYIVSDVEAFINASDSSSGVFLSYETCGFQNKYDDNFLSSRIAGRHMKVSIPGVDVNPWIYKGEISGTDKSRKWEGNDGILVDMVDAILRTPDPKINLSLSDNFASQSSSALFPLSSYSACCLDVAVGTVDMCIGDFWVTSERLAMGIDFLYSYSTDNMMLLARNTEKPPTLGDILRTPWQPFSSELWGTIVCYVLVVSAAVTLITDSGNEHDFVSNRLVSRWMKAAWLNSMGFVSRSIKNNPKSTPARVAAFGYGFFLLVTLQSWTAALASTLVARNANYGIRTFQDALDRNARICCLQSISAQMKATWPRGTYVITPDWLDMFRKLTLDKCDVALVSESEIPMAMSGAYNKLSCEKEDAGEEGWEQGASGCERHVTGEPSTTRDCRQFRNTGDIVMQIPFALPAAALYAKALSVEVVRYISDGAFDRSRAAHMDKVVPKSACGVRLESSMKDTQLGLDDMSGTIITAVLFQILALLLWALESYSGKSVAQLVGLEATLEAHHCDLINIGPLGHVGQAPDVSVPSAPRTHALDTHTVHAAATLESQNGNNNFSNSMGFYGDNREDMPLEKEELGHVPQLLEAFQAQQQQAMRDLCWRLGATPPPPSAHSHSSPNC